MKKLILLLAALPLATGAFATINGNGYYRVQNYGSQRWASLIDNQGSVDLVAETADLHALQLNKDYQEIISDPGSIVYITNLSGSSYNISAQGTSLESLIGHDIHIGGNTTADNGEKLYQIWGTSHNITKYISDGEYLTSEQFGTAIISSVDAKSKYKQWLILPVNVNSDNYFAAQPDVTTSDGGLYTTLFTSFGYKPYSTGVKAYYIGRVGFGMVEMVQINGSVPPGSPVVIQCASENPVNNKLEITGNQDALPNNALKGVYFNYTSKATNNHVAYDPATMRVLGKCADGSLGFVTSDIKYIPANSAYLKVPVGSAPEFKCVTTSQYEANLPDAPEGFYTDSEILLFPEDEYTYSGTWHIANAKGQPLKFIFHSGSGSGAQETIGVLTSYGKDYNLDLSNMVSLPFSYGSPYSWVIPNWTGGDLKVTINLQYQYVQFTKTSGVESLVVDDDASLSFSGDTIYGTQGKNIQVFNLSGQLLATSAAGNIDVSNLPKGIYIAKSGNKSIKIVR